MIKTPRIGWLVAALLAVGSQAQATPSTQIWIPSTDSQAFKSLHLNYDVYARPGRVPMLVLGPTVGVLPWKSLQAELGFDLMFQGNSDLDKYPLYFHGKVSTPEGSLHELSPSLAVGAYNVGVKRGVTAQNVGYALAARTLPFVGRLSAGYYLGNAAILRKAGPGPLDATSPDNRGLLLSWDRSMKEISEKLWVGIDYQQGDNMLGAVNYGFSWAFTKEVSAILGYDHYFSETMAGKDTFTVQLDINI